MRDNGYNADGSCKDDNPLLYPHLNLDAPQPSNITFGSDTAQLTTSSTTTVPLPTAPAESPVALLHAVQVAVRDALSGGISLSTILLFVQQTFGQMDTDPAPIVIDD